MPQVHHILVPRGLKPAVPDRGLWRDHQAFMDEQGFHQVR